MKKVLSIIMLFIGITSCTTENDIGTNQEGQRQKDLKSRDGINYGEMHNDILEIYYADYDYNSNDVSLMENAVEEYLIENESTVTFNDVKSSNSVLYYYSQKLYATAGKVNDIKNLFKEINEEGLSTQKAYDYSLELLEIFELYEGDVVTFTEKLNIYRIKVNSDSSIDGNLKNNLLKAVEIGEYSHMYWYEIVGIDANLDSNSANAANYGGKVDTRRIAVIAGGDVAGALTGIQSGLVGYASLVFGPWGGAIAMAGTAAVGSLNAARVLR